MPNLICIFFIFKCQNILQTKYAQNVSVYTCICLQMRSGYKITSHVMTCKFEPLRGHFAYIQFTYI